MKRPEIGKKIEVRRSKFIVPSTRKLVLPLTLALTGDETKEYNHVNVEKSYF